MSEERQAATQNARWLVSAMTELRRRKPAELSATECMVVLEAIEGSLDLKMIEGLRDVARTLEVEGARLRVRIMKLERDNAVLTAAVAAWEGKPDE